MKNEFEMSDLGYLAGMKFVNVKHGFFLHQKKYVEDILNKLKMGICNPVITPTKIKIKLKKDSNDDLVDETLYKQIIGSLRCLCNIRPSIFYSVGLVRRFMEKPVSFHLIAAKESSNTL